MGESVQSKIRGSWRKQTPRPVADEYIGNWRRFVGGCGVVADRPWQICDEGWGSKWGGRRAVS